MHLLRTTTCIVILFLVGASPAFATHIMGGSLTYTYVGNDEYALELSFYRDCSKDGTSSPNAPFNATVPFRMRGKNGTSTSQWNVSKTTSAPVKVKSAIAGCTSSSFCAEVAYYRDTITLGSDTGGYHIWVPLQARNDAIDNYVVYGNSTWPPSTYMNWYTFIPAKKHENSSPTYVKASVPYICAQRKNIFNAGFYDPDGDSLVFSFDQAFDYATSNTPPNFTRVSFRSGYSVQYPFGTSSPAIAIDPATGLITAQANNTGEYVIVVKIDEYRVDPLTKKVTHLGNVYVDLQFIVMSCGTSNKAPYWDPDPLGTSRTVTVGDTVKIKITGKDTLQTSGKYDTLKLSAYGSMLGNVSGFPTPWATFPGDTALMEATSTFNWVPSCAHVTYAAPHVATFTLEDEGCYIIDTSYKIYVKAMPGVVPTLRCMDIIGTNMSKLTWTPPPASGFNGYVIYRKKLDGTSEFEKARTISDRTVEYWVDSVANNVADTAYEYFFSAIDGCGNEVKATESFTTILLKSTKLSNGNVKYTWNNISPSTKDSFVVLADTGTGLYAVDTVNAREYTFTRCKNLKVKVSLLSDYIACSSNSALHQGDNEAPLTFSGYNAVVKGGNTQIDVTFKASKSTDIRHYIIYRSVNGGPWTQAGTIIPSTDTLPTFSDMAIDPAANNYCYYIEAIDYCENKTVTGTLCPINLSASAGNLKVNLNWTKFKGYTLDSIYIDRKTTAGWAQRAKLNGADTSFIDSMVTCKTYYYRIRGKEKAGNKQITISDSLAVTPFDTVAPPQSRIHFAYAGSKTQVTMNFSGTPAKDPKHFIIKVYENGSHIHTDSLRPSGTTPWNTPVFLYLNPITLTLNTEQNRYCYTIQIQDSCGNMSVPHEVCLVELTAKVDNQNAILNWHPYVGDSVVKYYISRKRTGSSAWETVDSVSHTDTSYIDSNLLCNVNYSYRIDHKVYQSKLGSVAAIFSDTAQVITYDSLAPAAPFLRTVSVKDDNAVTVSFNRSVDNDVKEYKIYGATNGGAFSLLHTITNNGNTIYTWDHTGLNTLKNTYSYYITAVDTCAGNISEPSATHRTIQLSGKARGDLKVVLNWTPYQGAVVDKYFIEARFGTSPWVKDSVPGTDTSYVTPLELYCNAVFDFRVYARLLDSSFIAYSDTTREMTFDTVAPPTVDIRSVMVISDTSNLVIYDLSASPDVNKYEIYASKNGGTYQKLETLLRPTSPGIYYHYGINTLRDTFCYQIKALDSCSNSISVSAETHCPIQLTAKAGNMRSELTWSGYKGWNVHKYYIFRWNLTKFDIIDSVGPAVTNYTDLNRPCNAANIYRVTAKPLIASAFDTTMSDTALAIPYDTVRPQMVNMRSVTVYDSARYIISFDTVPDSDVDRYEIYVSKNNGPFTLAGTVHKPVGSPVLYYDTITPSHIHKDIYCYQVRALDSCSGNKSAATETHCPVQLEGEEQNYANQLSWSPYSGFTVKNYQVQEFRMGSWVTLTTLPATSTTYTHGPITCREPHTYKIKVIEDGGTNLSFSDSINLTAFDTQRPAPPVIEYVTQLTNNSVYIKWTKSPSIDVTMYRVSRRPASGGSWQQLNKVLNKGTDYTDVFTGADTGGFCYTVQAIDSCVENYSDYSNVHCNVFVEADTLICNQHIYLNWNDYYGWAAGVNEYNIYKRDKGSSTESLIATLPGTEHGYVDSFVTNKKERCYRVEAIQNAGTYKSFSAISCAKAYEMIEPKVLEVSKIATSPTNGAIKVRWQSVAGMRFYRYYSVYHKPHGSVAFTLVADSIPVAQDTFIHTGINTRTQDHEYYIDITDTCENVSPVAIAHKSMDIDAQVGQLKHDIQWTPYIGWPVKEYQIERLEKNGYQLIQTVAGTDTATTVFPAPCNYNIYYRIKAVDASGNYAYSDTVGKQAIDSIPPNGVDIENITVVKQDNIRIGFTGGDSLDTYEYVVQRANNGVWGTAGSIPFGSPGQNHVYDDITPTGGDRYNYTILTLDSCLNVAFSDTFSPIQLRGKPLNQAVSLNWHPFQGYELDNYKVLLYNTGSMQWDTVAMNLAADTVRLFDSLHCNYPYIYKILGEQKGGALITLSDSNYIVPFDTIRPEAPELRYASVLPNQFIELTWEYDARSDVKYYEIWRKQGFGLFQLLNTVTRDSVYIDKTTAPHTFNYSYYVIAIDSCDGTHRSMPSDTDRTVLVELTTGACVPLVRLKWDAYTTLPAGTQQYDVYRSEDGGATWMLRTSVDGSTTNFVDSTVVGGKKYTYRIDALDLANNFAARSDTFSLRPWVFPIPQTAKLLYTTVTRTGFKNGAIEVHWPQYDTILDTFAAGYRIYYDNGSGFNLLHDEPDLGVTSFTHTSINTESSTHAYYVSIYNLCDVEGNASAVHRPVNLDIVNKNLRADIQWTRYSGENVKHYELYKSFDGSAPVRIQVFSPLDSSYIDTNLYCDKAYDYTIRAILNNGRVSWSDSVSIVAFDTIPPAIPDVFAVSVDTTHADEGAISILYKGNNEPNRNGYRLYRSINGAPYKMISFIPETATGQFYWQDKKLNTQEDIVSYYITATDTCGNESAPSDIHTGVHLEVNAQSQFNKLEWTPYQGFGSYSYLLEKRDSTGKWRQLANLPPTDQLYHDSDVHCFHYYDYRIKTVETGGAWFSFSNMDGDTAFENVLPEPSTLLRASVAVTGEINGEVIVEWNGSPTSDVAGYYLYRSQDNANWQTIAKIWGKETYTDKGLNTRGSSYFYNVAPFDSCDNTGEFYSPVHKTIVLGAKPGNQEIRLQWTAYQGWVPERYDIYRDGELMGSVNGSSLQYTDPHVLCTHSYTYWVVAVAPGAQIVEAASNTASAQPWDHVRPAAPYLEVATVDVPNEVVKIQWEASPSFDARYYHVYKRSGADGHIDLIDSTDQTFYMVEGQIKDADCYYVSASDHCGNVSERSNAGCPIILKGAPGSGTSFLSWNQYETWPMGVESYSIYRNDDSLSGWRLVGTTTGELHYADEDLSGQDVSSYCYQVVAVQKPGDKNMVSRSTVICLHQDPVVYVPNSFSPGISFDINDTYGPVGTYIKNYRMAIYNRWGQAIYETTEGKPWDGTYRGVYVTPGVYMYVITIESLNRTDQVIKGNVTIVR